MAVKSSRSPAPAARPAPGKSGSQKPEPVGRTKLLLVIAGAVAFGLLSIQLEFDKLARLRIALSRGAPSLDVSHGPLDLAIAPFCVALFVAVLIRRWLKPQAALAVILSACAMGIAASVYHSAAIAEQVRAAGYHLCDHLPSARGAGTDRYAASSLPCNQR
jgi:hypothetical protein